MKVVVLVSGRGSNLQSLLDAIDAGRCEASVVAVISDRAAAPALALAHARGIATEVVNPSDYPDRTTWDAALARAVATYAPELVVLAGFMRILEASMLQRFAGRMVNVHPALLPAFPGRDAPAQAVAKRVSLSGCTVHLVDAGVDSGPILAQAAVPVLPADDAVTLHERIQRAEHWLLPAVIQAIANGSIVLESDGPRYTGAKDNAATIFYWPPLT